MRTKAANVKATMHEKSHDPATTQVHPGKAAAMAVFHLAALFSPLFFTWEGLAVFLLLRVLPGLHPPSTPQPPSRSDSRFQHTRHAPATSPS